MGDIELVDRRTVVVTALPLKLRARQRLADQLGDVRVVDIKEPVAEADLVLAPSCSPQTIAALKDAYPSARLVVVEIEDWDLGVDLPGPVLRVLKAGADGYVTAESVDDLAAQLSGTRSEEGEAIATVSELPTPGVDDVILSALAERLEANAEEARGPGSVNDRSP